MGSWPAGFAFALIAAAIGACTGSYPHRPSFDFSLRDVVKTDIDRVAEIHLQETLLHLKTLMQKLYRRNPAEWRKNGDTTMDAAVARIFEQRQWDLRELQGRRGAEAIVLAFKEDFSGDRIAAYIVGLTTMILSAYGDRIEFYALDDLDPQKLYISARNVEIAVWRLSNARNSRNELYLLSNEDGTVKNLSFEREFGKIIAELDTMARIVSTQNNRSIVRVIQNVATAMFLPI